MTKSEIMRQVDLLKGDYDFAKSNEGVEPEDEALAKAIRDGIAVIGLRHSQNPDTPDEYVWDLPENFDKDQPTYRSPRELLKLEVAQPQDVNPVTRTVLSAVANRSGDYVTDPVISEKTPGSIKAADVAQDALDVGSRAGAIIQALKSSSPVRSGLRGAAIIGAADIINSGIDALRGRNKDYTQTAPDIAADVVAGGIASAIPTAIKAIPTKYRIYQKLDKTGARDYGIRGFTQVPKELYRSETRGAPIRDYINAPYPKDPETIRISYRPLPEPTITTTRGYDWKSIPIGRSENFREQTRQRAKLKDPAITRNWMNAMQSDDFSNSRDFAKDSPFMDAYQSLLEDYPDPNSVASQYFWPTGPKPNEYTLADHVERMSQLNRKSAASRAEPRTAEKNKTLTKFMRERIRSESPDYRSSDLKSANSESSARSSLLGNPSDRAKNNPLLPVSPLRSFRTDMLAPATGIGAMSVARIPSWGDLMGSILGGSDDSKNSR